MPSPWVPIVGAVFVAGVGAGWLMGDEHVVTKTVTIPSDKPPTFVIHDVPLDDQAPPSIAEAIPQDCAKAFGEVFPTLLQASYDLSRNEGQASLIINDFRVAQVDSDPLVLLSIAERWDTFTDSQTNLYRTIGTETHDLVVARPDGGLQIDPEFNKRCILPMQEATK